MKKVVALILVSLLSLPILNACTSENKDDIVEVSDEANVEEIEDIEELSNKDIIFKNPTEYAVEFEGLMKAISENWGGNELSKETQSFLEENQMLLDIFEEDLKGKLGNKEILDEVNMAMQDFYRNQQEKGKEIFGFFDNNDNFNRSWLFEDKGKWVPVLGTDYEESVEHIIGSSRDSVIKLLKGKRYVLDKKYTENVDPNAIELEKDELGVLVFFDENDIAKGVYFMSWDGDFVTGEESSVALNYDELILLATDDETIPVTDDLTEYNDAGLLKFPTTLIIGNVPEG